MRGKDTYSLTVFPGNPTKASIKLQMFSGCQVVKQGIKLWTVADTLLNTQQVFQNTAPTNTERERIKQPVLVDISTVSVNSS